MTAILGLSAYFHDSAAALVIDGEIMAAAQEERFSRQKHDAGFPARAMAYVLDEAGLTLDDINHIAFHDKPFLKFERLLETYIATAPRGFSSFRVAMPIWLKEKLFMKSMLIDELRDHGGSRDIGKKLLFAEHHMGHAASAFYPSPFDDAVILTMDGVGEWATTSVSLGSGNRIEMIRELHFPHSLGLLYSAATYYLGFKVNSGEYKVMGLAPYGTPRFRDLLLDKVVDLKPDGSFRLNQHYFDYATGLTMTNAAFADLLGAPVRQPETDALTPFHMDVAASVQAVTEEIVLTLTRALADEFGQSNLCMAGGVALNCVANGKIARDGRFKNIWVQPAAGDAGGSLGAALSAWHDHLDQPRTVSAGDTMRGAYLGPRYERAGIVSALGDCGAVFDEMDDAALFSATAEALANGQSVAWFQGRMEFGPRALGGRSILADPRVETMQRALNLQVKFRESFRPFAPAILAEDAADWFEIEQDSPYMLMVAPIGEHLRCPPMANADQQNGLDRINEKRSTIPAVTHVDYSARVQTVHRETNPRFHALLSAFKARTGCPLLVNTSFNIRGEPIVATPEDAFRCFMGTGLDMLVVENCVLMKTDQTVSPTVDHRSQYALD